MNNRIATNIKILLIDPILFFKKLKAKIIPLPGQIVQKKINGIVFEFDFNYDPAIKSMYFGTYEVEIVKLMKKFLGQGGIFIDIGANIGYLSAIAMGFVGENGEVHSFEPVPEYYSRLKKLAIINKNYNLITNQFAIDEKEGIGQIDVTNLQNIGWNTMVPGLMSIETRQKVVEVMTIRMDNYIKEKKLDKISLIKIDTEGYEFRVLKGLSNYFEETKQRPPIICEIAPSAYEILGCTLSQLARQMDNYGYGAFNILNTNIKVDITKLSTTTNVVFMPKRTRAI
jgi:FkbM family methyltransferase